MHSPLIDAQWGDTPLIDAARQGRTDVVEELIRRGTDVNVQNEVRYLRGYCELRERNGGR